MNGKAGGSATVETLRRGAVVLRRFTDTADLLREIEVIAAEAPFRRFQVRRGKTMSVAMTNCGALGWVSDHRGYRYEALDPASGRRWPPMPEAFALLARRAAAVADFGDFSPDACLVNRYGAGDALSAHQDVDERSFDHPIVSVSIGLPARFSFGTTDARAGPRRAILLADGDVVVWGGPARLAYHAIGPLASGWHPLAGPFRFNLTLRRAG